MISKETIRNTMVCYLSADDQSFVAQSAMIPNVVIGVGETKAEAKESFETALNDVYEEIVGDNVAGYKAGRPSKGYVAFNTNIRPSSRAAVIALSKSMDISQGEVVDYLVFYYECKKQEPELRHHNVDLAQVLQAVAANEKSINELSRNVHELVVSNVQSINKEVLP